MALSVLNDTQRRAVEYVLQRSEEDSLRAFPSLLRRVKKLGYEKEDLERLLSNIVHRKFWCGKNWQFWQIECYSPKFYIFSTSFCNQSYLYTYATD